jgi:hypothetical protein
MDIDTSKRFVIERLPKEVDVIPESFLTQAMKSDKWKMVNFEVHYV